MTASVYYNDSEPFVCDWLENLMGAGLIPKGVVDRRPIQEVMPSDVQGYTQCHFFAGIGGWAYALQLAGWGDRPVWTGSCPCQPFSAAGKRQGHQDERHLWPEWHRLIKESRPPTIFGEQVASDDGRAWLAAVRLDLEEMDYAVGAADLCAAWAGAPHGRQRLWFVGDATGGRRSERAHRASAEPRGESPRTPPQRSSAAGGMADAQSSNGRLPIHGRRSQQESAEPERGSKARGVAYANGGESGNGRLQSSRQYGFGSQDGRPDLVANAPSEQAGTAGLSWQPWDAIEWIPCTDGKWRPVEPGTFPLAHGIPQRLGRVRAYGNAIVPQVAAAFVSAYLECGASVPAPRRETPE